jgi:hypothetical protein
MIGQADQDKLEHMILSVHDAPLVCLLMLVIQLEQLVLEWKIHQQLIWDYQKKKLANWMTVY